MGYLASASTIYARAYLTSRGREYLFNNGNIRFDSLGDDLFKITTFTLGDPDVNYNTDEMLPAGHVPDISGKYDSCLKTALDYEQRNLLFFSNFDQVITEDIDYTTDANGNIVNVNVNLNDNDLPVGTDGTTPTGGGGIGGAARPLAGGVVGPDTSTPTGGGGGIINGGGIGEAPENRIR